MRNHDSPTTRTRLLTILVAAIALFSTSCTWIIRVSVQDTGGQVTGNMVGVDVTDDGRFVVFATDTAVSPFDTNGLFDVYLRDTAAGTTTAITGYNGHSRGPVISGDGSSIAFHSSASDIVAGDTNGVDDVFAYDTTSGATTRVSESTLGAEGNGHSRNPDISDDGSQITFESDASNLVATDPNGVKDVFVNNGASTSIVSRTAAGPLGNGDSRQPAIAGDASVIVFESDATNMVAGDTNGVTDVFRRTATGITTRISTTSAAGQANGLSQAPSVNGDGSVMAFHSIATNLIAGDTNATTDVFVKLATGVTERVSIDTAGAQFANFSLAPDLDNSGDRVAMQTSMLNVGTPGGPTTIVRDRAAGRTDLVARDEFGLVVAATNGNPAMSGDGRYVGFVSTTALVDDDTNLTTDVFLTSYPEPDITSVVPTVFPRGQTTVITLFGSGFVDSTLFDNFNQIDMGINYSNVQVLSANQIQAEVTVDPTAPVGIRSVWIQNGGTGPSSLAGGQDICGGCVSVS